MHAAWGEPIAELALEYPGGQSRCRAFVRSHLPAHIQDLQPSLGECAAAARLLEDVVLSLWQERTVPAASGEHASPEAVLFWNCLQREKPALADEVSSFLERWTADERQQERARGVYNDACTAVFREEWKHNIVQPLAVALEHLRVQAVFAADSLHCEELFVHRASLDSRRQRFLGHIPKEHQPHVMRVLAAQLERFAPHIIPPRLLASIMRSFNDVSRGFVYAPPDCARNAWT